MKKLLLIVLVFMMLGVVSAADSNVTQDTILSDTEYNSGVDNDERFVVAKDDNIPVSVKVDESWSLNVYIDRQNSSINGELENVSYSQLDIPTSIMNGEDEVPLGLGYHRIVYEFKFTNTTAIYRPDAYISDSVVYFDFEFMRNVKNPQNSVYRFTSQFTIVEGSGPISTTINLGDINITRTDTLFFSSKGISSATVNFYLDDDFFTSTEIDETPFLEELDTSKLAIGSYNIMCIVQTGSLYGQYKITADNSDSMINVNFARQKITRTPNKYIATINATLNVRDFPDLNPIYVDAPPVDVTYTRSIPIRIEGDGLGNLAVLIDGEKVYDDAISLLWDNTLYIPTKNADGKYFDVGTHDLSFEYTFQDKYIRFNPDVDWYGDTLVFNFMESTESSTYLNDKYIANTELNIHERDSQFIPIDCDDVVSIVHTDDINLKIDGISGLYNLTVFVDDVEIHDVYADEREMAIKTFTPRESIDEKNERDIKTGKHKIRFEFASKYEYDVEAEFKNGVMHFKFTPVSSDANPKGVYYQLNTSLIVSEKPKTVHIINVKNHTYFDDTEFIVKMDTYDPEDDDDWDEEDENPIGTQDVGIIVSMDGREVYRGDDLMNVYERLIWNYDFENEKLPKAGTYTMKIINLADNTYDTLSFEVKKESRTFSRKYSSDDFNVLFNLDFSSCRNDLNDPLHIVLAGEEKTINVKKGSSSSKKEVLFTDVDPGTYTATFTLEGNDIYKETKLTLKVTVKKENPEISCQSSGNSVKVTVDIPKSKTDAVLTVSAGGIVKKFTVNKNTGRVTANFNGLPAGYYNVEVDFEGNERYNSKTLSDSIEISSYSPSPQPQPSKEDDSPANGVGNNSDGIGTGSGNSNVLGSGNGTYNGRLSLNGNGFNGDLGSQGSGHGDAAKGYEINKILKKIDENSCVLWIFVILAFVLLFISFLYERRDDDEEEY